MSRRKLFPLVDRAFPSALSYLSEVLFYFAIVNTACTPPPPSDAIIVLLNLTTINIARSVGGCVESDTHAFLFLVFGIVMRRITAFFRIFRVAFLLLFSFQFFAIHKNVSSLNRSTSIYLATQYHTMVCCYEVAFNFSIC